MTTTDENRPSLPSEDPVNGWAVPGVGHQSPTGAGAARSGPLSEPGSSAASSEPGASDQPDATADAWHPRVDVADRDVADELAELRETGAGGSTPGGVHPVLAAVHDCLTALRSAKDASVLSLSAEEIKVLILAVTQIIAQAVALKLRLLVAGDVKDVAALTGATSTATFLSQLTQTVRAKASGEVRLAKDLDRRFPLMGEAFAAGLMSLDQVKVCVTALRKLPKDLPVEKVEACQKFLVEAAQEFDPKGLKDLGRRLWEVIDPDAADRKEGEALEDEEELARAKAYFRSWRNGDGSTGFRGKLPDAQFDILNKLIQAYAAPRRRDNKNIPTPNNEPDDQPNGDPGSDPGSNPGSGAGAGSGAPCDQPEAQEHPEEKQTGKKLPWPVICGHGLIDLIEHIPATAVPFAGGMPASVVITLDFEKLLTGLGAATLDTGTKTSASQARRMACNAGIIPIVLDGDSQPLDIGREQRLHTRYQRIAMAVRDNGCVVEGCDRPPAWTEAHHLIWWEHGGPTNVEDGALGCGYHHTLFHHPKWTTTWLPNGRARLRKTGRTRT